MSLALKLASHLEKNLTFSVFVFYCQPLKARRFVIFLRAAQGLVRCSVIILRPCDTVTNARMSHILTAMGKAIVGLFEIICLYSLGSEFFSQIR